MTDQFEHDLLDLVENEARTMRQPSADELWRTGRRQQHRRRVATGIGAIAGVAATVTAITLGANVLAERSDQTLAAVVDATPAQRVQAQLAAELAAHPQWPQRPIQADQYEVRVPYGPKDPKDYLAWTQALGPRFGDTTRLKLTYFADQPGVPTLAELDTIKDALTPKLHAAAAPTNIYYVIYADSFHGVVRLKHSPTQDPDFLAFLTSAKTDYGDRLLIETTTLKDTYD